MGVRLRGACACAEASPVAKAMADKSADKTARQGASARVRRVATDVAGGCGSLSCLTRGRVRRHARPFD